VRALGSAKEDTRTLAYMLLAKRGRRAIPVLLQEARKGRQTAGVLQVLGDIGDPGIVPELEPFAHSDDPAVAAAARESIEVLQEAEQYS